MRFLGLDITRRKAAAASSAMTAPDRGTWFTIFDSFRGAWQRDVAHVTQDLQSFAALYACLTLISSDIGKLGLRVMQRQGPVWVEVDAGAASAVLRKPNHYQTRQQFITTWVLSLLQAGATFALKERGARGTVERLHVLDAKRTQPLISTSGEVFYELNGGEPLAGVSEERLVAPASEIIHDRINCLYHPLLGTSPIMACGLAASQGLAIQATSAKFFKNGAQPGGVLTGPAHIPDETARRIKTHWDEKFTGDNAGRVAVLGDGLAYHPLSLNAVDAELIAQLKMSADMVCTAFHVPGYKVGVGAMPTYQNAEVLNQIYYTDCLQSIIESIEAGLDEGLGLSAPDRAQQLRRTEFDIEDLLRMDSATKTKVATDGIKGGMLAPDEARQRFNLPPVAGGATPYLQQQNFSLAALAKRDAQQDPFSKSGGDGAPPPEPPSAEEQEERAARAALRVVEAARALQPPAPDVAAIVAAAVARRVEVDDEPMLPDDWLAEVERRFLLEETLDGRA